MMFPLPLADAADIAEVVFFLVVVGIVIVVNIVKAVRGAMKEERTPQRRRPRAQAAQRPSSPGDAIEQFLREIAGQSGETRPSRPRPAAPRPPQPLPPRREPEVVMAELVEPAPKSLWREPAKPLHKPRAPKRSVPLAPLSQPRRKPVRKKRAVRDEAEAVVQVAESVADRIGNLFPKDPLKRAIALREILGPCRNAKPFRTRDW